MLQPDIQIPRRQHTRLRVAMGTRLFMYRGGSKLACMVQTGDQIKDKDIGNFDDTEPHTFQCTFDFGAIDRLMIPWYDGEQVGSGVLIPALEVDAAADLWCLLAC